jgi:hypothetical protein
MAILWYLVGIIMDSVMDESGFIAEMVPPGQK